MDYDKLKRLFKDGDWQQIDTLLNVDIELISKFDPEMIKSKFSKYENNKYSSLMNDRELKLFSTVKVISMYHIRFLLNTVSKLLRDEHDKNIIETLKKECDTLKTVIDTKDLEIKRLESDLSKSLPDRLREKGVL